MVVGKEREAVQHVNQVPLKLVGYKGVALQYIQYFDLRPRSKRKSSKKLAAGQKTSSIVR